MKTEHIFVIDDDKFFAKYFIMRFKLLVNDRVEFHHFTKLLPVFKANEMINPSLIFLDNELSGESGVDAIPELLEQYPEAEIILISSINDPRLVDLALANGASRFLSKDDIMMDRIAQRMNESMTDPSQKKVMKRLIR